MEWALGQACMEWALGKTRKNGLQKDMEWDRKDMEWAAGTTWNGL